MLLFTIFRKIITIFVAENTSPIRRLAFPV